MGMNIEGGQGVFKQYKDQNAVIYQNVAPLKEGIVTDAQSGEFHKDAKEQMQNNRYTDRNQNAEKDEQQGQNNHCFERFRARADAEKYRELVSLALQRNVSTKSRREQLQDILGWVGTTRNKDQREKTENNEYLGMCSSVSTGDKIMKGSVWEFQDQNGIREETQMLPCGRSKLKNENLTRKNTEEDKAILSESDKSSEASETKQKFQKDAFTRGQQPMDAVQKNATNKKSRGKHEERRNDIVERRNPKSPDEEDYVNIMKEDQALQQNARVITTRAITEAISSSYNEEVKKCSMKIQELYSKIKEEKEVRKIQKEKEKLQEQEMLNLHQKFETIQQAYEENVTQNRQLRERIVELRRENKDSQMKLLDERATRAKHMAACKFKMKEMEKNYERTQRTTISLEREVEKLEFQRKLDESKINRLEAQVNALDEKIEQKDLVIEQLIRDKHRKRGLRRLLGCF